MKIVADENIPLLMECFGPIGEVVALPGRSIAPEDVQDADALLVRSVTKVNKRLVENSTLKFVGTATAGFDHIDQEHLVDQDIAFSYAPGCNAIAVVEYVLAALDVLTERDGFQLHDRKVGIVGKGQVGGRLYQMMKHLGVAVCACDPLLESSEDSSHDSRYVSIDKLIECSDIICLHTPLTMDGQYPTHHLIGEQRLQAMKPGTVLINAGRGPVVDNTALKKCLNERNDLTVVLDVWEHEPDTDPELIARVDIATPHIAGYSLDGKIRGTKMIYKTLLQHFGLPHKIQFPAITPLPVLKQMTFSEGTTFSTTCSTAIRSIYDIRRDDAVMRKGLMGAEKHQRKLTFDRLRKDYPERREFNTLRVELKNGTSELVHILQALQFKIENAI